MLFSVCTARGQDTTARQDQGAVPSVPQGNPVRPPPPATVPRGPTAGRETGRVQTVPWDITARVPVLRRARCVEGVSPVTPAPVSRAVRGRSVWRER
jgi:hypothetical protein